mmetsp:Transcript_9332/g.23114  ORF Transcript_9332/g.23114 Transcript_9332/m.23114 type:complete len:284 (-) Transcript_9332:555-1406(-)
MPRRHSGRRSRPVTAPRGAHSRPPHRPAPAASWLRLPPAGWAHPRVWVCPHTRAWRSRCRDQRAPRALLQARPCSSSRQARLHRQRRQQQAQHRQQQAGRQCPRMGSRVQGRARLLLAWSTLGGSPQHSSSRGRTTRHSLHSPWCSSSACTTGSRRRSRRPRSSRCPDGVVSGTLWQPGAGGGAGTAARQAAAAAATAREPAAAPALAAAMTAAATTRVGAGSSRGVSAAVMRQAMRAQGFQQLQEGAQAYNATQNQGHQPLPTPTTTTTTTISQEVIIWASR